MGQTDRSNVSTFDQSAVLNKTQMGKLKRIARDGLKVK